VIDDPARPLEARKVLVCSGKIYYQLLQRREELETADVALVRVEQFYPFPEEQLKTVLSGYARAESWAWVQEAPENMGGWPFMRTRLEALIGQAPLYVGRKAAASPATGFPNLYKAEQAAISDQAVGPLKSGTISA
jgi:2-oxoglutarate dehydrogenase E1 component